MNNIIRKLIVMALGVLLTLDAQADYSRVEINGLYYNIGTNYAIVTRNFYNKYTGAVDIPSSVNYNGTDYQVRSIDEFAFSGCSGLTSISIPNSVRTIGSYAFQYCSGLTSVSIPNSVVSIFYGAFSGCSALTSIIVEDGNIIYDSRDNCNAIITGDNTLIVGCKNTFIPNNVTKIGSGAFSGCSALTSINIPNNVTSIGSSAFYYCI